MIEEDLIQVEDKVYIMSCREEPGDEYEDGFRTWEYIYRVKDNNGQTLDMSIYLYDRIDKSNKNPHNTYLWSVMLTVYSKKRRGYEELRQTGRSGLTSLLIAKEILRWHIKNVLEKSVIYKDNIVTIGFDDIRRKKTYERGLRDLGFKIEKTNDKRNQGELIVGRFTQ